MRILIGSISMELMEFGSKDQLDGELNHCDRSIKLDYTLDPVVFYYIYGNFNGTGQKCGIGIYSEQKTIRPQMLVDDAAGVFWIGWDDWAVAISLRKFDLISTNSLSICFYEFIPLPNMNRVLIWSELDLLCMDSAANLLWQYSGDIITNVSIKDDRVDLQFFDYPSVSLRMDNGKEINGYWG